MLPILVWMKLPLLTAVGISQVIQPPIAASATIGKFQRGELLVRGSLAIAVLLALGDLIGARVAHRLPTALLERTVAGVLIAVGVAVAARIFYASWLSAHA